MPAKECVNPLECALLFGHCLRYVECVEWMEWRKNTKNVHGSGINDKMKWKLSWNDEPFEYIYMPSGTYMEYVDQERQDDNHARIWWMESIIWKVAWIYGNGSMNLMYTSTCKLNDHF